MHICTIIFLISLLSVLTFHKYQLETTFSSSSLNLTCPSSTVLFFPTSQDKICLLNLFEYQVLKHINSKIIYPKPQYVHTYTCTIPAITVAIFIINPVPSTGLSEETEGTKSDMVLLRKGHFGEEKNPQDYNLMIKNLDEHHFWHFRVA